jgi:F-type H+-transporting ATPase subunit a
LRSKKTRLIFYYIHFQNQGFSPLHPYLCANFRNGMTLGRSKSLLVAVFSLFSLSIFNPAMAGGGGTDSTQKNEEFNAAEVIFGHILDGHEFHFMDIYKNGEKRPVSIPLPIILYSPQRGWTIFMSSKFHHGHEPHKGYRLLTEEYLAEMAKEGIDAEKEGLNAGKIIPVTTDGKWDRSVKVYDVSITRNVVQMILVLSILVWIMLVIAKRYKRGEGVTSAPKGVQNLIEPIVTFVRDEVAKPNLGAKYEKYLPYLLTVFFFILINNIFGLIPGSANVTGNIAVTAVLGLISFVVILFSSKKHYWGHIINPPGMPVGVKIILIPVEILNVFIKPFALIIRLFANMVGGHIIVICLISLIFIFAGMNVYVGWGSTLFSIAFTVFIYFIEILVAFIQAFIFVMLTAVFIGQSFEGGHDDAKHHEDELVI